jgi:alkanesulfonate monooxygenase SsuD/methylene tetrahydromethanopterin reductase-like flavin-dependent oxidoreductase (luciferase family)
MEFHTRGRRFDEQIELLRALWTNRRVDFTGKFDTVTAAGIAPMPVQRPIPVWVGSAGASETADVASPEALSTPLVSPRGEGGSAARTAPCHNPRVRTKTTAGTRKNARRLPGTKHELIHHPRGALAPPAA